MNFHKILIFVTPIIYATLFVLIIYIFRAQIYDKLKDWKLVYIPESFTELYFTDHLNLPKTIAANKDQNFKFTIHNLENSFKEYEWQVNAVPESTDASEQEQTVLLSAGREVLAHDESKNIDVQFKLESPMPRQKIEVKLLNMDQTIHYWIIKEEI